MTLSDIKAECEEHEARTDDMHARVDKFSDEDSGSSSEKGITPKSGLGTPAAKIGAFAIVIVVAVAAVLVYTQVLVGGTKNDETNDPPTIISWAVQNNTRAPMIWINASDSDDLISTITIAIYRNASSVNPMMTKVYTVDLSSTNISDTLNLSNLPAGDFLVKAYATDGSGERSELQDIFISLPL